MSIWQRITGGWKTHGPNAILGAGAFDSTPNDSIFDNVNADTAFKLSAFSSGVTLRSETVGSLPIHLRDATKKVITDHAAYEVLHNSPNIIQTPGEHWSAATGNVDVHGNAISVVERRNDKSVISIEPMDPCKASAAEKKSGKWMYTIDGEKFPAEDVLHLKGFSMDGKWGLSRLQIGREILASQIAGNTAAARAFKQSLKIGGFFEPQDKNPTKEERKDFMAQLDRYGLPENNGKYMLLLKGFKAVSGKDFRINPAEAELLQSRYFGIEEICRLLCIPPQLIGHVDKASSWASSLEQINLYFLMYSVMPTIVRFEQRINKTLLTNADRARGLHAKFNIQGLLRSDMKTQALVFATALQNGYFNVNEVRDLLDRMGIGPEGDEFRVQLNMGAMSELDKDPAKK
jgi:HK97 family phage portal protein